MDRLDRQVTVIEFLEDCFQEEFLPENRRYFLELSTLQARNFYHYMLDYLESHDDFYVPKRNSRFSRPFVWHEIAGMASAIGGNVFNPPPVEQRTINLRNLLLLYHQVVITDQLWFLLSSLIHSEGFRERYVAYIDFLLANRQLIDKDILVITSDKRAYDIAPGKQNYDLEQFLRERSISRSSGMLGYMELTNRYNSDVLIDNERYLNVFRSIFEYFGRALNLDNLSDVSFRADTGISAERLSNEDFINIRLTDDAFAKWHQSFSAALEAENEREFRDIMHEGIIRLNEERPSIMEGTPQSFVYAIISGILMMPVTGIESVVGGTLVGVAIELAHKIIRSKLDQHANLAESALVKHYTALLRSD